MIFSISLEYIFLTSLIALLLDWIFGEPNKYHPLIGFGHYANKVERWLNDQQSKGHVLKFRGVIAWLLTIIPVLIFLLIYMWFYSIFQLFYFSIIIDSFILYLAIGHKSLKQHALNVYYPLSQIGNEIRQEQSNGLINARQQVARIVSRDASNLNESEISRATIESVLENGHDAIIASLFWYMVGGLPLLILHRLANTLDAMWGYKNERFQSFGWFTAKIDDFLGWPSAKITAFLYAVQGKRLSIFILSIKNAYQQSKYYKSLNGGWAMAAGATVLNIQLGGTSVYDNIETQSIILGKGNRVTKNDILRSVLLIRNASLIWLGLLWLVVVIFKLFVWLAYLLLR